MRRLIRRLATDNEGTTILEFAFVGSIFIVLLIIILEAGLILWANSAMQTVASQTARCVALGSAACTPPNTPTSYATLRLGEWGVSGIVTPVATALPNSTCNSTVGTFIMVTITNSSSTVLRFMSPLSGVVLTRTACYPTGT